MWRWNDGWGHMGDWGWGWGLAGMLMMAVFWGAILLLLLYALRSWTRSVDGRPPETSSGADRAMTILRDRYARGEIDREEYEARRRTLDEPLHSD